MRLLPGADPGFQVRGGGGALKKIAPSRGRRENFWGISCEKSRFYAPGSVPDLEYLQTNDDGKSGVHLSAILRFYFFCH